MKRLLRLCVLPVSAALAAGCGDDGPPTGTVAGKVTIAGAAPAEPVRVQFYNATTGTGAGGDVGAGGEYELDHPVPVGEYKVFFTTPEIAAASERAVSTAEETAETVPSAYRNETSTPLTESVEEGSNTIDIDVPKE